MTSTVLPAAQPRTLKQGLMLAALGAVYGDIGTSPLYALKSCFANAGEVTPTHVLGVLSLIAWALFLVVTVKYVGVILRADNKGEGGILALTVLAQRALPWRSRWVLAAGLMGAALFYGDCILTPAISVLSAVEGIAVVAPATGHLVLPLTLGLLVGLFAVQYRGTHTIGSWFGPIMLVWFATLGGLGAVAIARQSEVLQALDPIYAFRYVMEAPTHAFVLMGAVVLAVTGAEALYADMGHFGATPVRAAWLFLVFPALMLNYFGQGALLLANPEAIENPFYLLAPGWAQWPMVLLATAATIIASQAVITGAYSITHQAIQLGYLPRMRVLHTSASAYGQVYVPYVNWLLLAAVLATVLAFQSSSAMAGAYGVAVTATMVITNVLAFFYFLRSRRWPLPLCLAVFGLFMCIDLTFLAANLLKLMDGGWFPLGTGLLIYLVMHAWITGKIHLTECRARQSWHLDDFIRSLKTQPLHRVDGTAVYMTSNAESVPSALINNIAHNKVIHQRNVLLTIEIDDTPFIEGKDKMELTSLGEGFERLNIHCGFMEEIDLKRILTAPGVPGRVRDLLGATYFSSRDTLRPVKMTFKSGSLRRIPLSLPDHIMRMLFISMSTWALNSTDYYGVPSTQVVEMGGQLEI